MGRERLPSGSALAKALGRTASRPLRVQCLWLVDGTVLHRIGREDAVFRPTKVLQKPVLQIASEQPTLQSWDPASARPRPRVTSSRSSADGAAAMHRRSPDAKAYAPDHRGSQSDRSAPLQFGEIDREA